MELTDYEIIQKCLSGRQEYFEELVTRYKKLIFSVVYNMINDKEEVSDISQEVFIRIYRALDRYNPEYKFSTWSVRIATNLCLDILERKRWIPRLLRRLKISQTALIHRKASYLQKERTKE